MVRVKLERASRLTNFRFEPPILHSSGVEDKFVSMVYSAISPILTINLQDFSILTRANLSDPFAQYRFFGGSSTVSLYANMLSMEFPNHSPEESDLILRVHDALYTKFLEDFPEHVFMNTHIFAAGHLTILEPGGASSYLDRFALPVASTVEGVEHLPGARFGLEDKNGNWRLRCTVELSEALNNGLFATLDMEVLKVQNVNFATKLAIYNYARSACMQVLEMEDA